MQYYSFKIFPGPQTKITWIKWFKQSLFKNFSVNNPIQKAASAITKITSDYWLQHEFIVVSYYDETAEEKTGELSIDWSNDSRM